MVVRGQGVVVGCCSLSTSFLNFELIIALCSVNQQIITKVLFHYSMPEPGIAHGQDYDYLISG